MEISDTELKKRLEAYNVDVPPITYTTRGLLIKKLLKLDSGEQQSGTVNTNKSGARNGRPTLQSTPSVTFSPNYETIDGYDDEYSEKQQFEEDLTEKQAYYEPANTSDHRDFIAEKTRYRKSKSPEARFRNNVSSPNVNKTSKYTEEETYPREIYTTERTSPKSIATYRNVAPRNVETSKSHTEDAKDKQSTSCISVVFKIIISLLIAFFFVVLYEYFTMESKQQLLS